MTYDETTINEYEATLTLNQLKSLWELRKIEREFAQNCDYDFGYGRYWETMTLEELREAQNIK